MHLDRAAGSGDRQRGELADRLRRDRSFQPVLTDVRTMSLTGWYGDPAGASEDEAKIFVADLGAEIAARLDGVLRALATVQPGVQPGRGTEQQPARQPGSQPGGRPEGSS